MKSNFDSIHSIDCIGATAMSASTRYVVAFVHSGSGSNNTHVYLNGAVDGTTTGSPGSATASSDFIIGNDTFNSGRGYNGTIGEIWHMAGTKSAGWIAAHSNALYDPSTFSTGSTETAV